MLSTTRGFPIARITGNRRFNCINIYIEDQDENDYEDVHEGNDDLDIYDIISEDEIERELGSKRLINNNKGRVDLPEKIVEYLRNRQGKEFHIKEGALQPLPDLRQERDVLYVAGPSGSGKSTYIGMYLRNYQRTFPKNKIIIFSAVDTDQAFDNIQNIVRIRIDNDLLENPVQMDELADTCVVFDDIDVISDKDLKLCVQGLRNQCLEIGRHNRISICCTSHQLLNWKETRTLINESHSITVFPKSGSAYHIKRLCTTYLGMSKKGVDRLLNLPSRWVTIHKSFPMYIMYNQGAYMLGE
jgi:predicted AAA+ superfamily ATPase